MTTSEQIAIDAIRQQLDPILQETEKAEAKLAELKNSKKRLEAALKALTGSVGQKASKSRGPSKPYAKKADVFEVCKSLVQDNPTIPKEDLETLVKERLAETFNLSGVSLRISECLASKHFSVLDDNNVRLNTPAIKGTSDE